MKFFRPDHGGGVVPADRPAAALAPADEGSSASEGGCGSPALDASLMHGEATAPLACAPGGHGAAGDSAAGRHFQRPAEAPPPSPCPAAEEDGRSAPTLGSSPKRALHLEHDLECPVANPDPHSRPRSRQFFRLGRHRSKAIDAPAPRGAAEKVYASTSDSSDDELHGLRPKPAARRRLVLRKPGLRRTMSLPVEPPRPLEGSSTDDDFNPRPPTIAAAESADDVLDPTTDGTEDDRLVQSERPCRLPRHRRTVTFACVQIREYSTILGDHPCCPSGPPLSLGWELQRENSVEFESYERERLPARKASKEDIKLSDDARRGILRGLAAPAVDGAEEGSDSSEGEGGAGGPRYSSKELRRAERRLTRDRAGLNARAHRRAHRGFFQPLTAAERAAAAAGSPMKGLESTEASDDEPSEGKCCGGSCRMDISPVKPKDCAMENEAEA